MSKIKDPSAKKTKKKFPLHPFELVWYPLCGLVGIWGIVYIVLGLVALNLPVTAEDGDLVKANAKIAKTFGLDFFGWGLIILAIAAVAIVVALLLFSNKVDREYEKTVRRAQRMAQLEAEVEKEESFVSDTGYDALIRKGHTYLKNHNSVASIAFSKHLLACSILWFLR